MKPVHKTLSAAVLSVAIAGGSLPASVAHAQTDIASSSIVGSWMLNKSLSDVPDERMQGRAGGRGPGGGGGGFGRRGGGGRGGGIGGFPGGGGGGFPGGGGGRGNPEDMARRQEALRDVLIAPERLTIVQTESMVIITAGDGRTTRLSLDDKKIKDESTNTERKTRWEAGKLVSEMTGNGGKVVETYSADTGHRELLVIVQVEGEGRDVPPRVFHRVYQVEPAR